MIKKNLGTFSKSCHILQFQLKNNYKFQSRPIILSYVVFAENFITLLYFGVKSFLTQALQCFLASPSHQTLLPQVFLVSHKQSTLSLGTNQRKCAADTLCTCQFSLLSY